MEENQYLESIKIMCKRCINHEICMGTGCTPKNRLKELYDQAERLEKAFNNSCNELAELELAYSTFDKDYADESIRDIGKTYRSPEQWKEWCMNDE